MLSPWKVGMGVGVGLLSTCNNLEKDLSRTKVKSVGKKHMFTGLANMMLGTYGGKVKRAVYGPEVNPDPRIESAKPT